MTTSSLLSGAELGVPLGAAELDSTGRLPVEQMPTNLGRDRGAGTSLPTTDLRRGDVYWHAQLFSLLGYTGTAWRQLTTAECTQAQREAMTAAMGLHRAFRVYETDTGVLLHYSGTAWRVLDGAGYARYAVAANATVAVNPSNLKVPFTVVEDSHADVTANAAGDTFTLNRAGLWRIDTAARFVNATDASRNQLLISSGDGLTPYIAQTEIPGAGYIFDLGVGTTKRMAAGVTISVQVYSTQATGVVLDTSPGTNVRNNIAFTYLRS